MVLDIYGIWGLGLFFFVLLLAFISSIVLTRASKLPIIIGSQDVLLICQRWLGSATVVVPLLFFDVFGEWRLLCIIFMVAYFTGLVAHYLPPIIPLDFSGKFPIRRPELVLRRIRHRDAGDEPMLVFAHLSDLHLTADETVERDIPKCDVEKVVRRSLEWALEKADLIFVTGDITDQGREAEWSQFVASIEDLGEHLDSGRIFVVPGNHDLSLALQLTVGVNNIVNYDARSLLFIEHILMKCPYSWMMYTDEGLLSVRQILEERSSYLQVYRRNPPATTIRFFGEDSKVAFDPDLYAAASQFFGSIWPRPDRMMCFQFIEMAYPMIMRDDQNFLIVGLNSATVMSESITKSAIGLIGSEQLDRFRRITAQANDRCVIVLIHHHIGFPTEKLAEFRQEYTRIQIRALAMGDAHNLAEHLSQMKNCFVFHGHKHFPYQAALGNTIIVSGHSATFGPRQRKSGCTIYQITKRKELVTVKMSPVWNDKNLG